MVIKGDKCVILQTESTVNRQQSPRAQATEVETEPICF